MGSHRHNAYMMIAYSNRLMPCNFTASSRGYSTHVCTQVFSHNTHTHKHTWIMPCRIYTTSQRIALSLSHMEFYEVIFSGVEVNPLRTLRPRPYRTIFTRFSCRISFHLLSPRVSPAPSLPLSLTLALSL